MAEGRGLPGAPFVVAIFGPTGVGKTGVSIELADLIRETGGAAVAVNCDAIQVYDGLQILSGAASAEERSRLDHRLLSHIPVDARYSSGEYARDAQAEIDSILAEGMWPLVVGGTGLYLRAALSDLDLLPEVPVETRERLERERQEVGAEAMHGRLPDRHRKRVHPNDGKRVLRYLGLIEMGVEPHPDSDGGGRLWTESLRHPTLLIGLGEDRESLAERISRRVGEMAANGAVEEARRAERSGASATARKAIGFEGFLRSDLEAVEQQHMAFARRQVTWMRKMEGVTRIERADATDREIASEIFDLIVTAEGLNASGPRPG